MASHDPGGAGPRGPTSGEQGAELVGDGLPRGSHRGRRRHSGETYDWSPDGLLLMAATAGAETTPTSSATAKPITGLRKAGRRGHRC